MRCIPDSLAMLTNEFIKPLKQVFQGNALNLQGKDSHTPEILYVLNIINSVLGKLLCVCQFCVLNIHCFVLGLLLQFCILLKVPGNEGKNYPKVLLVQLKCILVNFNKIVHSYIYF